MSRKPAHSKNESAVKQSRLHALGNAILTLMIGERTTGDLLTELIVIDENQIFFQMTATRLYDDYDFLFKVVISKS